MGRSGLTTVFLLVMTIVIVMLAINGTPGGIKGLWDKALGQQVEEAPPHDVTSPQAMSATDGMRQVDRAQRDMATMDSLTNSVRR